MRASNSSGGWKSAGTFEANGRRNRRPVKDRLLVKTGSMIANLGFPGPQVSADGTRNPLIGSRRVVSPAPAWAEGGASRSWDAPCRAVRSESVMPPPSRLQAQSLIPGGRRDPHLCDEASPFRVGLDTPRPQTGWWRRGTAHHRPPSSGGAVRAAEPGLSLVGRACPDGDPPISTGKAYGTSLAERPANRGDNFLARVACRWGDRRGRAREAASAPRSPAGRSTSAGVTAGQRVRPGTIAADRKGLVAT